MDVDDLFAEVNAVSTAAVARFADISEATTREWADELSVARIGASFAWTREDVEKLLECLDSEEEDAGAEDDDDSDDEENDDDEDEDETDDEDAEDEEDEPAA
jgi:hypothetical protein